VSDLLLPYNLCDFVNCVAFFILCLYVFAIDILRESVHILERGLELLDHITRRDAGTHNLVDGFTLCPSMDFDLQRIVDLYYVILRAIITKDYIILVIICSAPVLLYI